MTYEYRLGVTDRNAFTYKDGRYRPLESLISACLFTGSGAYVLRRQSFVP